MYLLERSGFAQKTGARAPGGHRELICGDGCELWVFSSSPVLFWSPWTCPSFIHMLVLLQLQRTNVRWLGWRKCLDPCEAAHPFIPLPGIFMSTCNVDVRWFPFDIQRCELKFGSWTYDGWLLDLQMNDADISGYMANGEWDLIGECE